MSKLDQFCGGPGSWGPIVPDVNGSGFPGDVDFTRCFEDTFITSIPIVFIVLVGLARIYYLTRSLRVEKHSSSLFITKQGALYLLIGLIFADLCLAVYTENEAPVYIYQPSVILGGLAVATAVLHVEHSRGLRSSGVMTLFWLLSLLVDIVRCRSFILNAEHQIVRNWLHIALFAAHFALDMLSFALSLAKEPAWEPERSARACPEHHAPFFSIITFWWLNPLMMTGYRRDLTPDDLFELNEKDQASVLSATFRRNWNDQVRKKGERASLIWALAKSFGPTFLVAAFFKLLQDLLAFVSPQLLKYMIAFTQDDSAPDWHGYMYASGLLITAIVQSVFLHQYFHRVMTTGMRLRSALVSAIYRKSLVLTNDSRQKKSSGEIVNLMAVDSQRFMDLMSYLQMIWSAPLQISLSLYFLWELLGPSVLAGLGVMLTMIPLNGYIAKKQRSLQVRQMKEKDKRIKMVNELLNGIKIIKLYAWERPFQRMVTSIRDSELRILKSGGYLGAAGSFSWNTAPFLVSLVTFITYTKTGNTLTADKAFVALSLFNLLRFPLAILPMMISAMVEASVSRKRLHEFLLMDEVDGSNVVMTSAGDKQPLLIEDAADEDGGVIEGPSPPAVSVEGGRFSWGKNEEPTLRDINFEVARGALCAVVGKVGSGKSSLVSALLGDMEKLSGTVNRPKSLAYVPQDAWIMNATLRDNVTFGRDFEPDLYDKVIYACGLKPDLEMLDNGDMTEIGEKGINLSGGQKQRVSLARAVYSGADFYIFDDPLSAVDSHVGQHIFKHVCGPKGMLKGKTRMLVTHAINFLPEVDQVAVLSGGKIAEQGSYQELIDNGGDFAKFLEEFSDEQHEKVSSSATVSDDPLSKQASTVSQGSTGSTALVRRTSSSASSSAAAASDQAASTTKKRGQEASDEKQALIKKEETGHGKVLSAVYWMYVDAIGRGLTALVLLFLMFGQASQVGSNFWLSYWSNEGEIDPVKTERDINMYLGIYGALGLGFSFMSLGVSLTLLTGSVRASRSLHNGMLDSVLSSPMVFFDRTPMGRIVNRFNKDIYTIDETIPRSLRSFMLTLMQVLSIVIVISINTWQFMLAVLPLSFFYMFIQRFYVATSRQLKRIESVTRSPIYAHFSECLAGVSSIRAYGRADDFIGQNENKVNTNLQAYYPSVCANRWLAMRLEFVGNCIIFFAGVFAVVERHNLSGGVVGLSLSYAMSVTQTLNWMVRMSSQLETDIVAVERAKEYSELESEAPRITADRPDLRWPQDGRITFDRYSVRYRKDLDLVLKDLSFEIRPGEKVGVVGRTGAGKSSMTLALFRILEAANGRVMIDGKDISRIGLQDLRSKITIMPQDTVMFSGTLRRNLDPCNDYNDTQLWQAIEVCHLKEHVKLLEKGLESKVSEGGDNFSKGQQQLLCLARAVLRKSKVLVLDEATSSVDLETDELIQKTIRSEFKECSIITIAHRLATIMDADRIMVLDQGRIVEFDSPQALMATPTSIFAGMAKSAGITNIPTSSQSSKSTAAIV